jgi:hypothetical protein
MNAAPVASALLAGTIEMTSNAINLHRNERIEKLEDHTPFVSVKFSRSFVYYPVP